MIAIKWLSSSTPALSDWTRMRVGFVVLYCFLFVWVMMRNIHWIISVTIIDDDPRGRIQSMGDFFGSEHLIKHRMRHGWVVSPVQLFIIDSYNSHDSRCNVQPPDASTVQQSTDFHYASGQKCAHLNDISSYGNSWTTGVNRLFSEGLNPVREFLLTAWVTVPFLLL